jgi:hypothetical protein
MLRRGVLALLTFATTLVILAGAWVIEPSSVVGLIALTGVGGTGLVAMGLAR